ncbi:uncharacterized protein FOMMEDRAFT_160578 [Fomitiporia mediterranea MF3/22]|uniref:uncharacterized protein n=1 Tax=Fomitiporia mediterranea (strain MF3/22) TaxID=694068 RepID=UPI0004408DFE|nr:uncharacterized protein FOMMEDRAFT_160578 [Fomitiporia mediterranea MF3/22]EJC99509.1 hypothetical protein FOMMEDRAFT_160578 [Fomitiporia mediterranea MF3/22]
MDVDEKHRKYTTPEQFLMRMQPKSIEDWLVNTVCGDCGGTIIEYDAAAGNGFCVGCGTVVEENAIVSEVVFGESSSGAAIVQGSFVGQGATHARMGGPYGKRNTSESREQTIDNASRKIRNVGALMRLSEVVQTAAIRMYTLALEHKFTKGRKNMNVIAVCLYIACRQKETRNYMLIDFSDLLQVNVFDLGHTFLQLVQTLNLRLPLVDPSHYIARFAALLEFGDETPKVAADAVRLVARFDRDWMSRGRRPAGICGACLLLAARMNNFRRSVQEVVQVVKIADTTLKKRLDEFKNTPSGALTLADFRTVWLEDEMDPPAFIKGKEKEAKEKAKLLERESEEEEMEEEAEVEIQKEKGRRKRKGKRKRSEEDDRESTVAPEAEAKTPEPVQPDELRPPIDPQLLNQGILAGTTDAPLFLPETADTTQNTPPSPTHVANGESSTDRTEKVEPENSEDDPIEEALLSEMNDFLHNPQGTRLTDALSEAEQRRQSHFTGDDELLGLDDDELDAFLLSEEEVKIKERVWVEMNKDYLEALAAKEAEKVGSAPTKTRKKRKTDNKPRDSSTPAGLTAVDAVRSMIKKSAKYSRRINYEALENLFASDTSGIQSGESNLLVPPKEVDLDVKAGDMFTIDQESIGGEGMDVVVEESGGGVGLRASPLGANINGSRTESRLTDRGQAEGEGRGAVTEHTEEDGEVDGEGEEIELSEKGEDEYVWDEGYEQEV